MTAVGGEPAHTVWHDSGFDELSAAVDVPYLDLAGPVVNDRGGARWRVARA